MISGGIKTNHFAQIGSIMKAYFGDSFLQVLFPTLVVLAKMECIPPLSSVSQINLKLVVLLPQNLLTFNKTFI